MIRKIPFTDKRNYHLLKKISLTDKEIPHTDKEIPLTDKEIPLTDKNIPLKHFKEASKIFEVQKSRK